MRTHRRLAAVTPAPSSSLCVGAGAEAFHPRERDRHDRTAKVEYLYVGLPNAPCGLGSCGSTTTTVSLNESVIRGGINFKFGGPGGFGFGW